MTIKEKLKFEWEYYKQMAIFVEMPNITSASQIYALCFQAYSTSSGDYTLASPIFQRNGLEIIGPDSTANNTIHFYFQCCLSYSKW